MLQRTFSLSWSQFSLTLWRQSLCTHNVTFDKKLIGSFGSTSYRALHTDNASIWQVDGPYIPQRKYTRQRKFLIFSLCHAIPLSGLVFYYGVKSRKMENEQLRYLRLRSATAATYHDTTPESEKQLLELFFAETNDVITQRRTQCFVLVSEPHDSKNRGSDFRLRTGHPDPFVDMSFFGTPLPQLVPMSSDYGTKEDNGNSNIVVSHDTHSGPLSFGIFANFRRGLTEVVGALSHSVEKRGIDNCFLRSQMFLTENGFHKENPRVIHLFITTNLIVEVHGTLLQQDKVSGSDRSLVHPDMVKIRFSPYRAVKPRDSQTNVISAIRSVGSSTWNIVVNQQL